MNSFAKKTPGAETAVRKPFSGCRSTTSQPDVAAAVPLPAHSAGHCACGGGCPRCETRQPPRIVPASDPSEREADRIAAKAGSLSGSMHRRVEARTAPASSGNGGSQPLEPALRAHFEPRLGADFSRVRIHRDNAAASSAAAVGARAFTLGSDIVFGAGQYRPETPGGRRLIAHELAHVMQQSQGQPRIQREEAGTGAAAAPAVVGTIEDLVFFLLNPGIETDAGLANALRLLGRYAPQVTIERVRFEVFPEAERESHLGHELHEGGDSTWEGDVPVIRLPQSAYDAVARHMAGHGDVAEMHAVVRTVGHEMHHLWRARQGHTGNPVQPVYEAEAARRMERVRANWLDWIQSNPEARREAGLPRTAQVTRWEDIPEAERRRIEQGAAQTGYIEGMYQHSAYLVEEILTKIEELSFLRVQQHAETERARTPSRMEVSELARLIHLLWNLFMNSGEEILTPQLRQQTLDAMLAYLRRRYPNRSDSSLDSFEVVFFLCAIHVGMPPLYSDGTLISRPPPGARVPPR